MTNKLQKSYSNLLYYLPLFLVGGGLYNVIECLYRGYTHISMFFAGGLCLLFIALLDNLCPDTPLLLKLLLCPLIITATELVFGLVLNVWLKIGVWDYSALRYNFLGQICPRASIYWLFLSVPALLSARLWKSAVRRITGSAHVVSEQLSQNNPLK